MKDNQPEPQDLTVAQQPIANPQPPQMAPSKYTAANDLMFEDCLKSIVLKSKTGKTYSSFKNKFCPKAKHSPFGDFPPEYLPKKTVTYDEPAAKTSTGFSSSSPMKSKLDFI